MTETIQTSTAIPVEESTVKCEIQNRCRLKTSSCTEKAGGVRLHEDGKVLRLRRASGGVVDDEVAGPEVEAGVAVEDAQGPQEVAVPPIPNKTTCLEIESRKDYGCLTRVLPRV